MSLPFSVSRSANDIPAVERRPVLETADQAKFLDYKKLERRFNNSKLDGGFEWEFDVHNFDCCSKWQQFGDSSLEWLQIVCRANNLDADVERIRGCEP